MATTVGKRWVGDDGAFLFGKYVGESVEHVAHADPGYLRWAVDEIENCDETDRRVLSTLLAHTRNTRNGGKR